MKNNSTLEQVLNRAIKKITEEIEIIGFNTVVSELMILSNEMEKAGTITRPTYETFLKLLAPLAPHITEELWQKLQNSELQQSIHIQSFPNHDPILLEKEEVIIAIQINGKLRDTLSISFDEIENQQTLKRIAKEK